MYGTMSIKNPSRWVKRLGFNVYLENKHTRVRSRSLISDYMGVVKAFSLAFLILFCVDFNFEYWSNIERSCPLIVRPSSLDRLFNSV
jgi:hypothetical protein